MIFANVKVNVQMQNDSEITLEVRKYRNWF